MKQIVMSVVVVVLTALSLRPSAAQTAEEVKALRKDIETLKQGQSEIQKELQEIKNLLTRGRQAPAAAAQNVDVLLSLAGDPFKGAKKAPVTLIEFSDYQCPFCARHFRETLPQIEKEYIQTGKVKYVMKDSPIESLHPQAPKGHEAAHCAGEQGKYWEMHARLFTNPQAMGPTELSQHAGALGLDLAKFQQCLDGGKYAAKVRKDVADGEKAGVEGTPTFFLGLTEGDETKIKAVRVIRGAHRYSVFKEAIESLLSAQK